MSTYIEAPRDANVDYKLLEAYGLAHKWYQPWQLAFFHEDDTRPKGKFVWYPEKGTLMAESDNGIKKLGEWTDCESICSEIVNYINA